MVEVVMSKQSRTKNSFINVITAVSGQGISIIISFIARVIFIRQLGEVYLGVNSLFTNIVGLLSLAELGVGTAINYSLYRPLAENDIPKIKCLMDLYRKVYITIGIVIILIGNALIPFLHCFMKASDTGSVANLRFIFFLFVLNSSVSYFYSYKRALIISDQKRYIATIYRYVFFVLMNIFQIIFLLLTKSFIVFLIITLICTIAENIMVSKKADKMYPFLKDRNSDKLDPDITNEIKKNTIALLYHKVGSSVVNSTDNILISKIVGIISVGKYSNYQLITNALNIIMAQLFMALTASIGNLGVTESSEKSERVLFQIFFLNFWINCTITASIYATVNLLIESWFGLNMILSQNVLSCIVINYYLYQIRRTVMTYRDAYGLFWYDRYKALVEAVINLVVSIVLGLRIGLIGIFIGTIVSTVTTSLWVEPYILFKYGFKKKAYKYYFTLLLYTLVTVVTCIVCKLLTEVLKLNGFIGFLCGVIVCVITAALIISIIFFRTRQYAYFLDLIKKVFLLLKRGKSHA